MKKLMTLIGAVATAFGLLAADPVVTGSASFESTREVGVDPTADTFTPASPWSWEGDPLTLGNYNNDAYTYVDATGNKRREFEGAPLQEKYLKLETTKSEVLSHAIAEGSIFVDQLVQFTGFEEAPAVDGAKIAVWMSEFVTQEEDETQQLPELTETNLYITAGVDSTRSAKASVKIDGNYEIGRWYRLTIKSLGVIDDDATVGFIVYIDGQQVGSSDDAAKALIDSTVLSDANKALLAQGKLFPAMTTGAIEKVGYNGIGAIDDLTIDDQGPEFARKIPFTAEATAELAILSIKDAAGNDVVPADGVANGTVVTVTYGPQAGYKILGDVTTASLAITEAGLEITPGDDIDVQAVVAKLNNTTDLAESELLATINAFKENDVLAILEACSVMTTDDEPVQLYGFTPNTTITVTAAGWNVYVGNYIDAEVTMTGMFVANVDIAAGTTMTVTFDDTVSGMFGFGGAKVNGQLIAVDGMAMTMADVTVGEAGLIKGVAPSATVTLVGAGKVVSTDGTLVTQELIVGADDAEIEVLPNTPSEGLYTYQIKQEEPKTGFAIIIAGDDETTTNYYPTLDAAITAAGTDGLPSVVTLLDNANFTATTEIGKAVTIDLNGKTLSYTNCEGLYVKNVANDVTIKNGTVVLNHTDYPDPFNASDRNYWRAAITFEDAGGLVKDVTVEANNSKYGVVTCSAGDFCDKTVACENVDVTIGSGVLFYCESEKMTLDANCSATQTGVGMFGTDFSDAVAASWLGQLTVNGGTYNAQQNAIATKTSPATITINGGTFTGAFHIMDVDPSYGPGGKSQLGDGVHHIAISGGSFSVDPSAYLVAGKKAELVDDRYVVVNADYVAQIGDDKYATVQAALAAAAVADTTKTVVLLKDVDEDIAFTMTAKRNVILDLNGYDLTGNIAATAVADDTAVFTIKNSASKTDASTITGDIAMTNGKITISQAGVTLAGSLVITDVIDASIQGTIVQDDPTKAAITVNGEKSILKISNTATIDATTAIDAKAGKVQVSSNSSSSTASVSGTITVAPGVTTAIQGGEFDSDISALVAEDRVAVKGDDGKWTVKKAIAKIGDVKYATLAEAVAVGGDVTLLADVTLTETLTIAKANAINLAGKTITFGNGLKNGIVTTDAAQNLVISNGTFAVAGTRAAGGFAFQLYRVNALIKDVEMNLTGFEYGLEAETMLGKPEYWTEELVYTITCENVAVTGNGSLFHFENVNATLDADCTATASGTSFGGAHEAAIYSSCGSIVTVNGGTYTAPNALQTGNLGGTIIVNAGTFDGKIKSFMYKGDTRWPDYNKAYVTIKGGTFGEFAYATGPKGELCTKDEVTWDITGGSFAADPTDYLAEGYEAVKNGAVWTVQKESKTGFAIIIADADPVTTNYYPTLDAAIAAAGTDGLPAVVTLLENATLTAPCDITKALTLDLNGFTLTGAADANWAIRMANIGSDVVIKNGTIAATKYGVRVEATDCTITGVTINSGMRAVQLTLGATVVVDGNSALTVNDTTRTKGEPGIFVTDASSLTIAAGSSLTANSNGGTITARDGGSAKSMVIVNGTVRNTFDPADGEAYECFAISGNGTDGTYGVDITIGDGAVVSSASAPGIFYPCAGTLNIGAATITGTEAVYLKAGATAIVSGATLTGNGPNKGYEGKAGTAETGDALVVANEGYPAGTANITVSGGTFTSANGAAVASYAKEGFTRVTGFISGGSFKGTLDPEVDLIAIGSGMDTAKWKPTEEGYVVPFAFAAVAQIGDDGEKFESLAAALSAAESGDTVTVLDDILTLQTEIIVGEGVTLDLNGKIVNADFHQTKLENGGTIVVYLNSATLLNNWYVGGTFVAGEVIAVENAYSIPVGTTMTVQKQSKVQTAIAIAVPDEKTLIWGAPIESNKLVTVSGGATIAAKIYPTATLTVADTLDPQPTLTTIEGFEVKSTAGEGTITYAAEIKQVKAIWIVDGVATTNLVDYNTVPTAPADPVVEGKTFTGWDKDIVAITEDTEYTAQFDDVMVKAIWIVDGVATTNEVVYNTVPATPADPEKANYTFTGWDKDTTVAIKADTEYTAQFEAITYKYTFAKGGAAGDATVADITYTVETAETLTAPAAGADWTVADSEFAGWTNTVDGGELILTGAELAKALKDIALTAVWVAKAPDFPLDPDDKDLDDNGKAAVETAKTVFGDGLAAYVAKVYGEGEGIPASKLNKTTEELIKIAKEYELPIMVAPTVAITQAAEGTGFEFQILDETVPVALQAEKVLSMVEFTTAIGDATKPFATATTDNVTVAIKADSKTATADFTKATAAGFMRVNLKADK